MILFGFVNTMMQLYKTTDNLMIEASGMDWGKEPLLAKFQALHI